MTVGAMLTVSMKKKKKHFKCCFSVFKMDTSRFSKALQVMLFSGSVSSDQQMIPSTLHLCFLLSNTADIKTTHVPSVL